MQAAAETRPEMRQPACQAKTALEQPLSVRNFGCQASPAQEQLGASSHVLANHPVTYTVGCQTRPAEEQKSSNLQDSACQTGREEDTSGQLAPIRLSFKVLCKFLQQ